MKCKAAPPLRSEEQKEKLSIASMDVTLSGTSFAYTGSCIRPAVTVEGPDMTLVEGTDYEVTFSANRYVGTARAVITGIGACEGQVVKTFRINPAKVTVSSLKKGNKYYVRIRAYKTVSGVRYYSSWSAKKSLRA
ncbi:MAG: hypothetical protein ACI4LA_03285 [Emergencia sp.]